MEEYLIGEDDYFTGTRYNSYEWGLVLVLMTTTSTPDDWYACHNELEEIIHCLN